MKQESAMLRIVKTGALFAACVFTGVCAHGRTFVHPGLSYTQGDLDRMKAMVAAKEEPFYSTFLQMRSSRFSDISTNEYTRGGAITADNQFENSVGIDGRRALDTALLWHITGDEIYAKASVTRINANSWFTNTCAVGTASLDNGKFAALIEAAELMRDYEGWKPEDRKRFFDMLVYPGYSSEEYPWNEHPGTTCTCYWGVFNFDSMRYGNQGLIGCSALIGIGVLLDNEKIFDRAVRYLRAQPHRPDDLPYPSGPANLAAWPSAVGETQIYYDPQWPRVFNEVEDWGYDEQIRFYFYPNGQCQESCRDQGHVLAGLDTMGYLAEVAWNQGVDLYGELDDRILKGYEWNLRLNVTGYASYDDQPEPWKPSGVTTNIEELSFDNDLFYRVRHRSGRWESLWIAEDRRDIGGTSGIAAPLSHYRYRAGKGDDEVKWLLRSRERQMTTCGGIESCQTGTGGFGRTAWGTLTKERRVRMAGDPGTWRDGVRISGAHRLPGTIAAADFDWYSDEKSGEGFTFHDTSSGTNNVYRSDATVAIRLDGSEGAVVTGTADGEWLQYTFTDYDGGKRPVSVRYRSARPAALLLQVDEDEPVELALPASNGFTSAAARIRTAAGAHVLRVTVADSGEGALELKSATFGDAVDERIVWTGVDGRLWHAENAWMDSETSRLVSYFDDADIAFSTVSGQAVTNVAVLGRAAAPRSVLSEISDGCAVRVAGDYGLVVLGSLTCRTGTLELATSSNAIHRVVMDGGTFSLAEGTTTVELFEGAGTINVGANAELRLPCADVPAGIVFTGTGRICVPDGRWANILSVDTLASFRGEVVVPRNATLGDAMPFNNGARFGENTVLRLEGGNLGIGYASNNLQLSPVCVPEGTTGTVWNTTARSERGQNLAVAGALSGSGTLVITSYGRGTGIFGDNSEFGGTLVLNGWGGYGTHIYRSNSAGSSAQWIHERAVPLILSLEDSSSIELGALAARGETVSLNSAKEGQTLTIGAREEGENVIDAPLAGQPMTIVKTGTGTLTLGGRFATENGGALNVRSGALRIESTNVNCSVTLATGSDLVVSAAETVRISSLTLQGASHITIEGSPQWTGSSRRTALVVDSASGIGSATFSYVPAGNGVEGTVVVSGTTVYVDTKGPLVWNGADGAEWSAQGAWLGDYSSAVTFVSGSNACFTSNTFETASSSSVSIVSPVSAGGVWADIPADSQLRFFGGGQLSAPSLSVFGGGELRVESATPSFTEGVSVSDGSRLAIASGWVGDVDLDDGTTLDIAGDAVMPGDGRVSGEGDISVSAGRFTIKGVLREEGGPFSDFYGDFTICSNAVVFFDSEGFLDCDMPPLGHGTLCFAGGTLDGFTQRNNMYVGPMDVVGGTDSVFGNWRARSQRGVNLRLAGPITGSGRLTVLCNSRWAQVSGTNTAFRGELVFTGWSVEGLGFAGACSGMPYGLLELNAPRQLSLSHETGSTMRFGALVVTNEAASIFMANSGSLEIGRRGDDSVIGVPMSGATPSIVKYGTGDLLFTGGAVVPDGSTVDVISGSMTIDGDVFAAGAVSVRRGARLHGDGTIGSLLLGDGAIVDNMAGQTIVAIAADAGLFTKRGEGRLVLNAGESGAIGGDITVENGVLELPVGSSLGSLTAKGGEIVVDATAYIAAAEGGSSGTIRLLDLERQSDGETWDAITVIGLGSGWRVVSGRTGILLRREKLVWSGGRPGWFDEDAWRGATSGESLTFADGDDVEIGWATADMGLGAARPASMLVTGSVTLTGGGTIRPDEFLNYGTVNVSGEAAFRFGAQSMGSFAVQNGARLVIDAGASFNWVAVDEASAIEAVAGADWSSGEKRTLMTWNYTDELGITAERLSVSGLAGGLAAQIDVGEKMATARVYSLMSETSPAEVIGLNFGAGFFNGDFVGTNSLMTGYLSSPTLVGDVPGFAWNNLYENVGSNVAANVAWNGERAFIEKLQGVEVTYGCNNLYGRILDKPNYLKSYFDDWSRAQILVENIPWPKYDVIVYASTDTLNSRFLCVEVNGRSYTWDPNAKRTIEGTYDWGDTNATVPAAGDNALVLTDIAGDTLSVTGSLKRGSVRGGIAALQIVNRMPLVWNGGSAGLRDAGKWSLFGMPADYVDDRGVAFTSAGLEATSYSTATVGVSVAASPARFFADVPDGRGYRLEGADVASPERLVKRGAGALEMACAASFDAGLEVYEGVASLASRFAGSAFVDAGASVELRSGGSLDVLSGRGEVRVTGGTLLIESIDTLATFGGSIVLEDATLEAQLGLHAEGALTHYGLGENTRLKFANATVSRLTMRGGTNNTWLPEIESQPGTTNIVYNEVSRGWDGMHMTLGKPLKGGGRLEFVCRDRIFAIACDAGEFSGELAVSGPAGRGSQTSILSPTAINSKMTFEYTRAAPLQIATGSDSRIYAGSISVAAACPEVNVADSGVMMILGESGGDSELSAPVTGKALSIIKKGGGVLRIGASATVPAGSLVRVNAGEVAVDSDAIAVWGGGVMKSGRWIALDHEGRRYFFPCDALPRPSCLISMDRAQTAVDVSATGAITTGGSAVKYRLWTSPNLQDWSPSDLSDSGEFHFNYVLPREFYRMEAVVVGE